MMAAGWKEVAEAKADGRWDKAYDPPSKMTMPEDFLKELSRNQKALRFFGTLNKANTYAIAWRLQTAKEAGDTGKTDEGNYWNARVGKTIARIEAKESKELTGIAQVNEMGSKHRKRRTLCDRDGVFSILRDLRRD